ncbi:MAG: thiamine diphosphokinase [Muribaculaceae bacterium]|nr:thiamine diphosphokinase [Muribaculaceae bacterium]
MDSILDFSPEAVIIDAGKFPENTNALRWLDDCDRIVCCDGAANHYLSTARNVWRIIGDCDSLDPAVMERYRDIVRRFPDQETNDQTKSVKYLAGKGIRRIAILGATGMREDHTLGNISLLIEYLKQGIEARAYTDYGVFIPMSGTKEFHCRPGSQVSIFNFGATGMRSEGLRYSIRDFDNWWQGTLNEATASSFTIHATGNYLVFLNY